MPSATASSGLSRSVRARVGGESGTIGATVEEQRLADRRPHGVRLERLRYEKRRFGLFARQQAFRIGGDENDQHFDQVQDIVDRGQTGTAVGELNVGEHESRLLR